MNEPRWKRDVAAVVVVVYLGYLAVGMYWHVVGDVAVQPAAQYFVTWDMFPGYRSVGRRIVVVGETESGAFVEVYPSPRQRWRSGLHGDLTRLDGVASPFNLHGIRALEDEVRANLVAFEDDDDQVQWLHVVVETWPAKFNLPPGPYGAIALDRDPSTDTRVWARAATWPNPLREPEPGGAE